MMTNVVSPTNTPLQLAFNEVFEQFGEDKEKMFEILNDFLSCWIYEATARGYDPNTMAKGAFLYFFFTNIIRNMEVTSGKIQK